MPRTAIESAATKPAHAGTTNLARLHVPSPELAAIVGAEPLTRAQATARTWDWIRAHDLQDEADRRQIAADDALRAVLGQDRVGMFALAGILGRHLTPVAVD